MRKYQLNSSLVINLRNSGNRKSKQQLYTGIKIPSPTILNKLKVMKMNTFFTSQKSLATN